MRLSHDKEDHVLSITSQYLARYRRLDAGDGTPVLLPVTGAQRRFALVRAMDPAGRPDLVPMFFAFPRGTVDPVRLAAAANRLAARHPVLRARPTVLRGTPVLRLERPQVPVTRETCAPGEDAAAVLRRALGRWAPEGSPLRLFLVPDGPEGAEEVVAVVLDHSACDGQSLARLVAELGAGLRRNSGRRRPLARRRRGRAGRLPGSRAATARRGGARGCTGRHGVLG